MPSFLFSPVPHTDAIDFIRSKPVVSREVFDQLLPELQARAFTISGMIPADVAQTVRDLIADVPAGMPWDTQKNLITKALSPYMDEAAAIAKAELLLRVHGQEAYASAADAVMRRNVDTHPYWKYLTLGDSRVRPAHRALHGLILPWDSPFWDEHDPPWEWGCRCLKIAISDFVVNGVREQQAKGDLKGGWLLSDRLRQELESTNRLVRGANVHDVTPTGTFKFDPQNFTMSVDQIKARYSPEVWSQFEAWSRKTTIAPGDPRTVWDWISGEAGAPESAAVAAEETPNAQLPTPNIEVRDPQIGDEYFRDGEWRPIETLAELNEALEKNYQLRKRT
jgi:SPP1 gp7 family putative phage head morphogenesis protein